MINKCHNLLMDFFGSLKKIAQTGFDGRGPDKFRNNGEEVQCEQCGFKRGQIGSTRNCSGNNVPRQELGKNICGLKKLSSNDQNHS